MYDALTLHAPLLGTSALLPWNSHMRGLPIRGLSFLGYPTGCNITQQAAVELLSCYRHCQEKTAAYTCTDVHPTTTCAYTQLFVWKQCIRSSSVHFGRSLLCRRRGLWFPIFTCVHASNSDCREDKAEHKHPNCQLLVQWDD